MRKNNPLFFPSSCYEQIFVSILFNQTQLSYDVIVDVLPAYCKEIRVYYQTSHNSKDLCSNIKGQEGVPNILQ